MGELIFQLMQKYAAAASDVRFLCSNREKLHMCHEIDRELRQAIIHATQKIEEIIG